MTNISGNRVELEEDEPREERKRQWVVPVVTAVVILTVVPFMCLFITRNVKERNTNS